MRRSLPFAALALTFGLAACDDGVVQQRPAPAAPAAARTAENGPPLYIVTLKDGVSDVAGASSEIARGNGFALHRVRLNAARGFSAVIPDARLAAVKADPRVATVEPNAVVALSPRPEANARPGGGGGSQTTPWGITRVGGAGDGTGKTAYVLDSGIDLAHPDLNTTKACHTYFEGTSPSDGNGHGTHVAGIIGAKNNGQDVVGVAANAYVCSVRVLGNSGFGSWDGIIAGIDWVAGRAASGDVANLSLGGTGHIAALETAVKALALKGVKVVIAAGNSSTNAGTEMPGRYNGTNIYTVSSISSSGCLSSFSNYGNPPVDYAAPGSGIVSTRKGGGTTTYSGTSQAAPHVAGILLLGGIRSNGSACNDPDGNPDPIASR